MLNKLFKSILEQDPAPIVVCDTKSVVLYMNPESVTRYHKNLTGKSLKNCHPEAANEKIDRAVS